LTNCQKIPIVRPFLTVTDLEEPTTAIIVGEVCTNRSVLKNEDEAASCLTDDPFGGVNKNRDCVMMSQVSLTHVILNPQVRDILHGGNAPLKEASDPFDYYDPCILTDLADRYKKGRLEDIQLLNRSTIKMAPDQRSPHPEFCNNGGRGNDLRLSICVAKNPRNKVKRILYYCMLQSWQPPTIKHKPTAEVRLSRSLHTHFVNKK
jgi:hypothetical protein